MTPSPRCVSISAVFQGDGTVLMRLNGFVYIVTASMLAGGAFATELRFCYQDKALPPYYLYNNAIPQTLPGASIEHLQQLVAAVPDLTLKLQRLPWKRCLAALASGEVDALISSDQADRHQYAQYPLLQGRADPQRAFARHATCFVARQDATWQWDGHKISGSKTLVVARPLGYAPIKLADPDSVTMHYTLSGTMDLQLLQAGRVQAVTTLCEIAGKTVQSFNVAERGLQIIRPPISYNTGYLVFSKQFYQRHQAKADALWQQLRHDKAEAIYHRYIQLDYEQDLSRDLNKTQ